MIPYRTRKAIEFRTGYSVTAKQTRIIYPCMLSDGCQVSRKILKPCWEMPSRSDKIEFAPNESTSLGTLRLHELTYSTFFA